MNTVNDKIVEVMLMSIRESYLLLRRAGVAAALMDGGLFRGREAGHVAAGEAQAAATASVRVRRSHVDELRMRTINFVASTESGAAVGKLQGG